MTAFDRRQANRPDVVIVGVGSLGSMLLQLLTRETLGWAWSWVKRVYAIDFDSILPHNVKSALCSHGDVGRKKVAVAQSWALGTNPHLQVLAVPQPVEEVGLATFADASAVFVCADTYLGKMVASRQAWRVGAPIERLFVTDSTPIFGQVAEKLTVVSSVPLLAQAISDCTADG